MENESDEQHDPQMLHRMALVSERVWFKQNEYEAAETLLHTQSGNEVEDVADSDKGQVASEYPAALMGECIWFNQQYYERMEAAYQVRKAAGACKGRLNTDCNKKSKTIIGDELSNEGNLWMDQKKKCQKGKDQTNSNNRVALVTQRGIKGNVCAGRCNENDGHPVGVERRPKHVEQSAEEQLAKKKSPPLPPEAKHEKLKSLMTDLQTKHSTLKNHLDELHQVRENQITKVRDYMTLLSSVVNKASLRIYSQINAFDSQIEASNDVLNSLESVLKAVEGKSKTATNAKASKSLWSTLSSVNNEVSWFFDQVGDVRMGNLLDVVPTLVDTVLQLEYATNVENHPKFVKRNEKLKTTLTKKRKSIRLIEDTEKVNVQVPAIVSRPLEVRDASQCRNYQQVFTAIKNNGVSSEGESLDGSLGDECYSLNYAVVNGADDDFVGHSLPSSGATDQNRGSIGIKPRFKSLVSNNDAPMSDLDAIFHLPKPTSGIKKKAKSSQGNQTNPKSNKGNQANAKHSQVNETNEVASQGSQNMSESEAGKLQEKNLQSKNSDWKSKPTLGNRTKAKPASSQGKVNRGSNLSSQSQELLSVNTYTATRNGKEPLSSSSSPYSSMEFPTSPQVRSSIQKATRRTNASSENTNPSNLQYQSRIDPTMHSKQSAPDYEYLKCQLNDMLRVIKNLLSVNGPTLPLQEMLVEAEMLIHSMNNTSEPDQFRHRYLLLKMAFSHYQTDQDKSNTASGGTSNSTKAAKKDTNKPKKPKDVKEWAYTVLNEDTAETKAKKILRPLKSSTMPNLTTDVYRIAKISPRCDQDRHRPGISSLVVLDYCNTLVLIDIINSCLKFYSIENIQQQHQAKFMRSYTIAQPYYMTAFGDNKIAVSRGDRTITVFKVYQRGRFEFLQHVQCNFQYYGMGGVKDDILACAFYEDNAIHLVRVCEGYLHLLAIFNSTSQGPELLNVVPETGNIVFFERAPQQGVYLTCIDLKGKKLFSVSMGGNESDVWNLTCVQSKIVCCNKLTNSIDLYSEVGTKLVSLPMPRRQVQMPFAIGFSSKGFLFVANDAEWEEDNNHYVTTEINAFAFRYGVKE